MPKASRQVLFSAVAMSVSAFALASLAGVREHHGILMALVPEGASTVSARALVTAPASCHWACPTRSWRRLS